MLRFAESREGVLEEFSLVRFQLYLFYTLTGRNLDALLYEIYIINVTSVSDLVGTHEDLPMQGVYSRSFLLPMNAFICCVHIELR